MGFTQNMSNILAQAATSVMNKQQQNISPQKYFKSSEEHDLPEDPLLDEVIEE